MKKIVLFVFLILLFVPSYTIFAQCDDELQGWIDILRNIEKELIECKGYGTLLPSEYIPCDESKIKKMHAHKAIQVRICNGNSSNGFNYIDIPIGDFIIRFLEFRNYKKASGETIFEFTAEFTNNSDQSISYNSAIYREVYQDGYELDDNIMGAVDIMTKIRPGMSIEVTESFEYREPINKGIIEIDMHPYFDNDPLNSFSGVIYKLDK